MAALFPIIGANSTRRTTSSEFKPGTACLDDQNRTWVYVGPASSAVTSGSACSLTTAFVVSSTSGSYTADAAFTSGDYGWVRKTTSPL